MVKQNCWETKKCGREFGGANSGEFGVCPAAIEARANGLNGGANGGRACWAIAGTMCNGEVQGTFASKINSCKKCDHYNEVIGEEGESFKDVGEILSQLI